MALFVGGPKQGPKALARWKHRPKKCAHMHKVSFLVWMRAGICQQAHRKALLPILSLYIGILVGFFIQMQTGFPLNSFHYSCVQSNENMKVSVVEGHMQQFFTNTILILVLQTF